MKNEDEIDKIKKKLIEGHSEKTLELLESIVKDLDNSYINDDFLFLKKRLTELNKKKNREIIDANQIRIEKNKIDNDILDHITEISKIMSSYEGNFFPKKDSTNLLELIFPESNSPNDLKDEFLKIAACGLFLIEHNSEFIIRKDEIKVDEVWKKAKIWLTSKKLFRKEELINSTFIKISNMQNAFKLRLKEDNTLQEWNLHNDKEEKWEGRWSLISGVLQTKIPEYELVVFKNQKGIIHTGIEFYKKKQISFFSVIQIPFRM